MRGRLLVEIVLGAVFGLLIGSFLNVCIYRIPRDLSVVTPRSFCPECGQSIAWYHNIPLLSFVWLRGRCRYCGKAIGLRYAAVELITAVLFAWTLARYGLSPLTAKWLVFEALLMVLFWTDLEERILPDEVTVGGILAGLIFAAVAPNGLGVWGSLLDAVIGGLGLAIPIWLLGILYQRIRKREGLGLGDVKLLALLGVFLGLTQGVEALMLGAIGGSLIGLAYILITRKKAATYELPFGSFLCASGAIVPLLSAWIH